MNLTILTALGVGGATVIGALVGFMFKKISHKFSDYVLSFAAGVMLAAAVIGLVLPSIESGGAFAPLVTVVGVICGALMLNIIDKIVPHLHKLAGAEIEAHSEASQRINKIMLFVLAIAIHNFPEGIAAGVGLGSGNVSQALTISLGIALQNIPEGMVIISPMLASGISKSRTLLIAMLTGVVEVIGTFIGSFAVGFSQGILPFALAFAGGTMLYIVSDEMIPETHAHGNERGSTYSLLFGFLLMLIVDFYLG